MKMNKLKEMNGQEIWSNSFGERFEERVCVLVEYPFCIHSGDKFKPTKQEIAGLFDDMITQELGSKKQIRRDLKEEFGKIE